MILADKIIALRKKNGWSQEELAEKMQVTRQSVSKWEGAQSVPDLNRILLMSRIFNVSVDYLLKDELKEDPYPENWSGDSVSIGEEAGQPVKKVSMEEACAFMSIKEESAVKTAAATLLCIISPICLIVISAAQEAGRVQMTENAAAGIGLVVLIVLVAIAVATFISCGMKTEEYEYLDREAIETEYGVTGMVKEKKREYQDTYTRYNIIGTCCCILAVIPLFATMIFTEEEFFMALAVGALLILVAIGVLHFVCAGIRWESMQKLLQEGDYTVEKKKKNAKFELVATVYWLVVTALYLGYSFVSDAWEKSWIIWPVAGVLYAVAGTIYSMYVRKE